LAERLLGAPMSPAWVHGSLRVEELALPKSVESGNLSVNKAVIRWMSVKMVGNALNCSPARQLSPLIVIRDVGICTRWPAKCHRLADKQNVLLASQGHLERDIKKSRGQCRQERARRYETARRKRRMLFMSDERRA
jgi:hypothetical protein